MKKRNTLFSILLFLFFISNINGQSFTDEGNQWATYSFDFTGNIYSYTYKIEGDSVLNGKNHKKLWTAIGNPIENNWNIFSLLREDSSQKVFELRFFNIEEELLYDFGLELGDTIYSHFDSAKVAMVEAVDSIILNDGSKRKRIQIKAITNSAGLEEEFWIEGIGGINTAFLFINGFWITDIGNQLQCFSLNGNILFGPHLGQGCYIPTSTDDLLFTDFTIFPNPVKDVLIFEYDDNLILKEYRIWNFQGQLLDKNQLNFRLDELDISLIPTGTYLLQIVNEKGLSFSKKFVKVK